MECLLTLFATKGAQKTICKATPDKLEPNTIQGAIELALRKLKSKNTPSIYLSSRTDSGVHALHSTCHVDLQTVSGYPFGPNFILKTLNSYFHRHEFDIRILNVVPVSSSFHARYDAIKRTYLYRIAVPDFNCAGTALATFRPIEERRRCHFLTTTVDINLMKEAAALFVGKHDFRTFMATPKSLDKITRRKIDLFEIVPDSSRFLQGVSEFPPGSIQETANYTYWNLICSAKSFLHKQIRRTIGVLLAVGEGKLTCRDVKLMLQIPSKHSWDPRAKTAPSHGLYLCKVEYKPESLNLDYHVSR